MSLTPSNAVIRFTCQTKKTASRIARGDYATKIRENDAEITALKKQTKKKYQLLKVMAREKTNDNIGNVRVLEVELQ